ncbi:TAXI family TRAP transporter solute-binding subunit [Methylobacterium dankookense]|uniref:C4-dicarboxylate ABC transporter substrate-binding protein n=1 Tax=Methylobacterium dankookense TaxID=560405 RepID=A0A564G483_9HYPH|nr:TAXI family TRAP transporter solute-binding subunit [Methylobacterium dankookense]GJD56503.1 hypothetical protein IFDJLNFL_2400 [Methylobacterium dankookense]VUF15299.1 hypothetical protein MTDSW087_05037 [Methylobacterium dankookense]
MPRLGFRRERAFLAAAILLAAAAATVLWLSRATTLTVAVAPAGGTEPAVLRAIAARLSERRRSVRLDLKPFPGVRESAEALQAGTVDLAVVRPDILTPDKGLTLAVLREQALLVAAPESAGLAALPDLAGRRVGVLAERVSDRALIEAALAHYGLAAAPGAEAPEDAATLVPVAEAELKAALAARRIDAVIVLTTPTTPAAARLVGQAGQADSEGKVRLFGVPDGPALIARMPRLQAVGVPAALFGGRPRIPEEEIATVGTAYRLMARADLSRSTAAEVTQNLFEMRGALAEALPAAADIQAPAYDSTVAATAARFPIHPGAMDYFEREQEGFIERYETWIYLVAFLGGGIGSALAWLRQRVFRIRRERVETATERLVEIQAAARESSGRARLDGLADEIDGLAAEIAREAIERPAELRTLTAAAVAVDAARSTVRRKAGLEG